MEHIRKFIDFEIKEINENDRSFSAVASTGEVDRDGDILEPKGWKLKNFRKNPVIMFAHDYRAIPIAKATEVKIEDGQLKFRPKFRESEFADEVFQAYKGGFMRAFSVGFIPLKRQDIEEDGEDDEKGGEILRRRGSRFTSQELLEISAVPVPALPSALMERGYQDVVAKSFGISGVEGYTESQLEVIRGVLPFKTGSGKDPDSAEWDAGAEVKKADVDDLKIMCAWYNEAEPDLKTSYKLPYRRQGNKNLVWRGVAAAMAALLGARGGVRIPSEDRKGVYNVLSKAYKAFDKEPPGFREYQENELRSMFDEVWHEELLDLVTHDMNSNEEDIAIKSGRVLSEKNRGLVKRAVEALQALLEASDRESEDEKRSVDEKRIADLSGQINELKSRIKQEG